MQAVSLFGGHELRERCRVLVSLWYMKHPHQAIVFSLVVIKTSELRKYTVVV